MAIQSLRDISGLGRHLSISIQFKKTSERDSRNDVSYQTGANLGLVNILAPAAA